MAEADGRYCRGNCRKSPANGTYTTCHFPLPFYLFSSFGRPASDITQAARDAVTVLDKRKVDFEYEGEMTADIALDFGLMQSSYPFSRLTGKPCWSIICQYSGLRCRAMAAFCQHIL